MKKVFFLLLVVILTQMQSCSYIQARAVRGIPMLEKIINNESMDEMTKMGFFDGCFTGYSARGNSFYKTIFYFRQNPALIRDDRYRFAWGRAYGICFPEAVMWSYSQSLGSKFVNKDMITNDFAPFEMPVTMPFGNDSESRPAVWYFDESIDRGLPGVAKFNNDHGTFSDENFYGVFGSCYLCEKK